MKANTQDIIKYKKLRRRLKLSRIACTGLLEEIWHLTQKNTPRGDIGKLSNDDIATIVEWDGDPDELVDALTECGWLDKSEKHRLVVHKWKWHAPSFVRGVLARRGETFVEDDLTIVATSDPTIVATGDATSDATIDPYYLAYPSLANPNQAKPSPSGGNSAAAGGGFFVFPEGLRDEINRECVRIHSALFPSNFPPCRLRNEREEIFRIAALRVIGELPESVVAGILRDVKQEPPQKPIRFFRAAVMKRCSEDFGIDAAGLMALVQIPEWAESMVEPKSKGVLAT